jgi:hypothetical protein
MDKIELSPLTKAKILYGVGLALLIISIILVTILTTDAYAVKPRFIETPFAVMLLSTTVCFVAGGAAIGFSYGKVFAK